MLEWNLGISGLGYHFKYKVGGVTTPGKKQKSVI